MAATSSDRTDTFRRRAVRTCHFGRQNRLAATTVKRIATGSLYPFAVGVGDNKPTPPPRKAWAAIEHAVPRRHGTGSTGRRCRSADPKGHRTAQDVAPGDGSRLPSRTVQATRNRPSARCDDIRVVDCPGPGGGRLIDGEFGQPDLRRNGHAMFRSEWAARADPGVTKGWKASWAAPGGPGSHRSWQTGAICNRKERPESPASGKRTSSKLMVESGEMSQLLQGYRARTKSNSFLLARA